MKEQRQVYVGHRYVPKIIGEWSPLISYEGLSIVQNEGNSFTSKKMVPIGIPLSNEEFWVVTGNYNAQIENYRQEVKKNGEDLTDYKGEVTTQLTQTESKLEIVNVKDFGAVGDGVTNDSLAFQSAINASSYKVLVPYGDYVVNNLTLNKPIKLYGFVPATKRKKDAILEKTATLNTNGNNFLNFLSNVRLEIENIYIIGNTDTGIGKTNKCFYSDTSPFNVVPKNSFVDSFGIGFDFSNKSWLQTVTHCGIHNCDIGILAPYAANNTNFSDNDIQYNRIGISAIGQVVSIERNHFGINTNTDEACVEFEGGNPSFRNNYFEVYSYVDGTAGKANNNNGTYPFKFICSNDYINVGEVVNNDIDGKNGLKHGFYFESKTPDIIVRYLGRFDQNKATRLLGETFLFEENHKFVVPIEAMYTTKNLISNSLDYDTKKSGYHSLSGSIANDKVSTFETAKESAILAFSSKIPTRSGMVAIGNGAQASVIGGTYFKVANKILTGDSEVGFVHVSYVNGVVYIENKLGISFDYRLTILG